MTPELEKFFVDLITAMEGSKTIIENLRAQNFPGVDARSLSVAATYLETAQLWVANARRD